MEDVVAQLPLSVRVFSFPRHSLTLRLHYKDCYIIRSGRDAVDYTGLRMWPGAHLLLRFLLHSTAHLAPLTACELGSGSGVCGLLCAHLASHCALTDRVPAVLDLLRLNVHSNQLSQHRAGVHHLDWGAADARALLQALPPPHVVHCVIAADVVYPDTADECMQRLFDTVLTLLHSCPPPSSTSSSPLHGAFVLSYVNRSSSTSRRLFDVAAARGFHCTAVPMEGVIEEEETRERSGDEGERTLEQEMQGLTGAVLLFRPDGTSEWRSSETFLSMTLSEKGNSALSGSLAVDDESTALPLSLDAD